MVPDGKKGSVVNVILYRAGRRRVKVGAVEKLPPGPAAGPFGPGAIVIFRLF